jgi:hypothetical protein
MLLKNDLTRRPQQQQIKTYHRKLEYCKNFRKISAVALVSMDSLLKHSVKITKSEKLWARVLLAK